MMHSCLPFTVSPWLLMISMKNHGNWDKFLLKRKYKKIQVLTYLCEDHDNQGPTVGLREGSFGYQSNYV